MVYFSGLVTGSVFLPELWEPEERVSVVWKPSCGEEEKAVNSDEELSGINSMINLKNAVSV